MEEYSPEEQEVARILVLLPRLVWDADHRSPSTHGLRWGARKRRSASGDNPPESPNARPLAAVPSQPLPLPALPTPPAEKLGRKRTKKAAVSAAAAASPVSPRKDEGPGAQQGQPAAEASEEVGDAPGSSSPETPLDFCPSAEEPDANVAKATAAARPPDAERPPAKKPKLKHEQLSKQLEQLNRTRTELQKEAAEIRNRLEALRERNSQLMELRIKLEKEDEQQRHEGRSCLDLLPMGPVRPAAAAHPQQQHYPQAWPQQWVSNPIVFHNVASGFSLHPSAAAAGKQQWNWAASWVVDGDRGGSGANKVPDLNSCADADSGLERPPPQGSYYYHHHPQVQVEQSNYYHHHHPKEQVEHKKNLEEQRAARKKRIEMMQKRRACEGNNKSGSFR